MLLSLQQGILYGPIDSRRLGRSLGINLMPSAYKLCSFNCVYCHYGTTQELTCDVAHYVKDMPTVDEVIAAVDQAFSTSAKFDYVTFSGNGEPTLHPGFAEIVKAIVELRDRMRPEVRIALLSNSTGFMGTTIEQVLGIIDKPYFKLDAGNENLFHAVNRPAQGVQYEHIIAYLKRLQNITIQTVFMAGSPANTKGKVLDDYFEKIVEIAPDEVQIYSLDRPVPNPRIVRVSPEELRLIAEQGVKRTGIRFIPYFLS